MLSLLEKKHRFVLKYLKKYKEEMQGVDFTDPFLHKLLCHIFYEETCHKNSKIFSTEYLPEYLDKALLLEHLKIQTINSLDISDYGYEHYDDINVEITPRIHGRSRIEFLGNERYVYKLYNFSNSGYCYWDKFYTDGVISFLNNDSGENCKHILIERPSFILSAIKEEFKRYREEWTEADFNKLIHKEGKFPKLLFTTTSDHYNIFIKDFEFNGKLLPSLEELQSKEKPKTLNKILEDDKN